jgi:hypothetical protein
MPQDLAALEPLLAVIDGQATLTVVGKEEARRFQLWFWKDSKDWLFTAPSLERVISMALTATRA